MPENDQILEGYDIGTCYVLDCFLALFPQVHICDMVDWTSGALKKLSNPIILGMSCCAFSHSHLSLIIFIICATH